MVKKDSLTLSNFRIDGRGKIIMDDGREVVATRSAYRLRVDRGRPADNQAGLPPTVGIDRKPGVGYSSRMNRGKVTRCNGQFGRNNTILNVQQRATEQIETADGADQIEAGNRFEESMSRDQRSATKRVETADGADQRRAEAGFNRQMGLDDYDH